MLDTNKAKRFARYSHAKRKLEAKAKEIGKKLTKWQEPLMNEMLNDEIDKISLKGGDTIRIDEKIWAKILVLDEFGNTDKEKIVAALREANLDYLVTKETFNHNSLAAYLRELDQSEKSLPESLKDVIKPNPVFKLITKRLL